MVVGGIFGEDRLGLDYKDLGSSTSIDWFSHPIYSKILVDLDGEIIKLTLKELYEDCFKDEFFEKNVYQKYTKIKNVKVYSYDKNSGKIGTTNIEDVIKAPNVTKIVKFSLITGRSFETTTDHPVLVYSEGKIIEI